MPRKTTLRAPPLQKRIARVLVDLGRRAQLGAPDEPFFTKNRDAEALLRSDPFAFLLAIIFDQSVDAEVAWQAPLRLRDRLGHLDPTDIWNNEEATRKAISDKPALHRFTNTMTDWVRHAAFMVVGMGRDVTKLWDDRPTAVDLQERLCAFKGIGQKKAAMAVELLERHMGVKITRLDGSDIAVDVHVRRVFLRAGLVDRDDRDHIIATARELWPQRPGALDYGAWRLGRGVCRARDPECDECPLESMCPKFLGRAEEVRAT